MAKIYQPQTRNQELPNGLFSWQVFKSEEQARHWLTENGDPEEQYDIIEYDEDDIEAHEFVESVFSTKAKELEEELWKHRDKEVALITECMKEYKSLFGFTEFDPDTLEINEDAELDLDEFSLGTICSYCYCFDAYFIGMKYVETPNDKYNPYRIDVYYVDENGDTMGVTDISNIIADSRCVLVDLIKNYA